jgi:hypothetical protein
MDSSEIPAPGELFRHAYRRVRAERDHLFRIAVIPVALYFLALALLRPHQQDLPGTMLTLALVFIPMTLFDVAWLRWLLHAGAADPSLPFRWTRRHTGYLGRLVALHLILIAAAMPVVFVAALFPENQRPIILIVSMPLFLYLSLRFSLFLVARTIDGVCDLRRSWVATRHGAWRFFWGAAFTTIPVLILLAVLGELVDVVGFAAMLPLVTMLLSSVASFALRALLLAVTAVVYDVKMMKRMIH